MDAKRKMLEQLERDKMERLGKTYVPGSTVVPGST